MKNIFYFMVCIMGITLISCQKEEPEPVKNTGTLHVNIGVLISVNEKNLHYKAAPVLDEFNVNICTADGTVVMAFENITDMPDYIELETGDYFAEAYSDNNLPAEFDNPYFYGVSDQFTISSNNQQDVQVNCELGNTVVSVVYTENIVNNFIAYTTSVSSSLGSLVFTSSEIRLGYFQTSPLDILAELSYEKPDGTVINKVITGSIAEPVAITEIMANPSALSDTEGEWFEIYNNSTHSISLQNLILERDDANIHTITDQVDLEAGAYYVLSRTETATVAVNEYVYGSDITLSNTGAVLSLYNEGSESNPGALICSLDYGETGFPSGTGASISLNPNSINITDAVLGSSWCISTSLYSTGDLGTPGSENNICL